MRKQIANNIFPKIVRGLTSFGMRQGIQAKKSADFLATFLKQATIPHQRIAYKVELPVWKKFSLIADGKSVDCLPTGLMSGDVVGQSTLVSSLISSRYFLDTPHISFNPKSRAISRANFSFSPSFAVSRSSLPVLMNSKRVKGNMVVEKKHEKTYQILVGNTKSPTNIVFCHFDSIGTGAIDNASGTALVIQAVIESPELLKNNLFVLDGNEELSYDYPTYWGRGYRNFQKKYAKQFNQAKKLIVVDCIGYKPAQIVKDKKIVNLAFPVSNIQKYSSKISLITSDFDFLMSVYHSDKDVAENLKMRFVVEAKKKLIKLLG